MLSRNSTATLARTLTSNAKMAISTRQPSNPDGASINPYQSSHRPACWRRYQYSAPWSQSTHTQDNNRYYYAIKVVVSKGAIEIKIAFARPGPAPKTSTQKASTGGALKRSIQLETGELTVPHSHIPSKASKIHSIHPFRTRCGEERT